MKNLFSCNLPQNNIYISQDGSVKICCYNHLFEIGNICNNSLIDLWNSNKRKEFAKYTYKNCNEPSCSNCSIKQPNKKDILFLKKSIKNNLFPQSIEFELSKTCNLECIMCSSLFSSQIENKYSISNNKPLKTVNIIEQISPFISHLKEAKFYGGEPFLIEQYFEIWEYIINNNPSCVLSVQTNGTILNDKVKTIINKGNFKISISLESIIDKTYSEIRINADLKKVLSNIEYFQNYTKQKKTYFGITICPIRNNCEEIPQLIDYFNKKNTPIYFNTVFQPFNVSIWNLPNEKILSVYNAYSQYVFTNNNSKVSKHNIKKFNDLVSQIYIWYKTAIEREKQLELISKKNENDLLEEITNNSITFLNSVIWLDNNTKNNIINIFKKKLKEVCNNSLDKKLLNNQLAKLLLLPTNILLSEIERISIQEIKENLLSL